MVLNLREFLWLSWGSTHKSTNESSYLRALVLSVFIRRRRKVPIFFQIRRILALLFEVETRAPHKWIHLLLHWKSQSFKRYFACLIGKVEKLLWFDLYFLSSTWDYNTSCENSSVMKNHCLFWTCLYPVKTSEFFCQELCSPRKVWHVFQYVFAALAFSNTRICPISYTVYFLFNT